MTIVSMIEYIYCPLYLVSSSNRISDGSYVPIEFPDVRRFVFLVSKPLRDPHLGACRTILIMT